MAARRHRHRQSRVRDRASLLVGLLLSLLLSLLVLLASVRVCVMSKSGVVGALDNTFGELLYSYVQDAARHYTLPTGIDPTVLEGVFVQDEVCDDAHASVAYAFEGTSASFATSTLENRLSVNVSNDLVRKGVTGNDAAQISSVYVGDVIDLYRSCVELPGVQQLGHMSGTLGFYVDAALGFLAFVALLLVIVIVRLHGHIHRGLRYVAYAVGGSALTSSLLPLVLMRTRPFATLALEPRHVYHVATTLVQAVLRTCALGASAYLALTVVLMAASTLMRRRALQSDLRKHSSHTS